MIWLAITLFAIVLPVSPSFGSFDRSDTSLAIGPEGGAYLVFAGKSGGEIRKSELTNQTELRVDGCAKGYRIMSYTLEVTSGQSKNTFQASSNQLTKEMKAKLMNLSKGDTFEFRLMKAQQDSDKHIVDVHSSRFIVV